MFIPKEHFDSSLLFLYLYQKRNMNSAILSRFEFVKHIKYLSSPPCCRLISPYRSQRLRAGRILYAGLSFHCKMMILRILNWNNPFDNLTKKVLGPNIQGSFVSDKRCHFPANLFHIKIINGLLQQMLEFIRSQWVVILIIT